MKKSLSLKRECMEREACEELLKRAQFAMLPDLQLSLSHNFSWGRSVDLQTLEIVRNHLSQSTGISLGSSMTLFDGLSGINRIRREKKNIEIAEYRKEEAGNDLKISITGLYLQVLLSKELLVVTAQHYHIVCEQTEKIRAMVSEGKEPCTSLLEIESQRSAEKARKISAENRLKKDLLELKQMMNMGPDEDIVIEPERGEYRVTGNDPGWKEELSPETISHPAIQAAKAIIEREEINIRIAKGNYSPRLSLSASYGTFYSSTSLNENGGPEPFFMQMKNNINPSVTLTLSVPIFTSGTARGELESAKTAMERGKLELEIVEQKLYKTIRTAILEAENYKSDLEAANSNLHSADRLFKHIEEKYSHGVVGYIDYRRAKEELFKAESDYFSAKYRYLFQLKIIEYYTEIRTY